MFDTLRSRARVGALILGLFVVAGVGWAGWSLVDNPKAEAATSSYLNFQGRLLTSAGAVVADGNYHIEFKIYDTIGSGGSAQGVCSLDSSSDDCWWLETRSTGNLVRVVNGYFSVNLGSVTAFGASIPWDQQLYLTMRVGGSSGSPSWESAEMLSSGNRMVVTGVPYAFTAGKLQATSGSITNVLTFATPSGSNKTLTLPNETGTICTTGSICTGYQAASSSTLQNAYNTDGDGSDAIIALTTADDGIILRNPDSGGSDSTYILTLDQLEDDTGTMGGLSIQSAGTGNLLLITDTTATARDVLTIADGGATTFRNQTDSSAAFRILDAAGTAIVAADTTYTDGTADALTVTVTPDDTAGTQQGLVISQASSANTNGLDTALLINNADDSVAIGTALSLTSTGGGAFTTGIDLSGASSTTDLILDDGLTIAQTSDNDLDIVENSLTLNVDFGETTGSVITLGATSIGLTFATTTSGNITFGPAGTSDVIVSGDADSALVLNGLQSGTVSNGLCVDASANVITCTAGSSVTLQTAYDTDVDGSDATITLSNEDDSIIISNPNDSANDTDSTFLFKIEQLLATGTQEGLVVESNGTGNLFRVTDTTATARDVLTIADGGATTLRNQTDSANAFRVMNAAGTSTVFSVDTTSNLVVVSNPEGEIRLRDTDSSATWFLNADGAGNFVVGTTALSNNFLLLSSSGAATFRNETNSTTALQIQNSSGTSLFTADTSNTKIGIVADTNIGGRFGNRLFSDNFETGNYNFWTGPIFGTTSTPSIDTSTVHNGKYSSKHVVANSTSTRYAPITSNATVYARAWVNVTSHSTGTVDLFALHADSGSTSNRIIVYRDSASSGSVCIWNTVSGSGEGCWSTGSFTTSAWHLIELRATAAGAGTSTTQLWFDGSQVFSSTTRNNGSINFNSFKIGDGNGTKTATFYIDDTSVDTVSNGTASSLIVDDSFHVGGTSSFGNSVLVQSTSNSVSAFQIQNSSGTSLFTADSSNLILRPGLGTSSSATSEADTQISDADLVGEGTSVAIGVDGLPIIAHYNETGGNLQVTKCTTANCSSSSSTEFEDADNVGQQTSIAIGTDGLPIISHYNSTGGNLQVSKCADINCTLLTSDTEISDADIVGVRSSIAIGADGLPIIAHFNDTNNNLQISKCANIGCTSLTSDTEISDADSVGEQPSIAIGRDGLPIISHYNFTAWNLQVSKCANINCTSLTSDTEFSDALDLGSYSTIKINTNGLPIIVHYVDDASNGDTMVSKCANANCTTLAVSTRLTDADSVGVTNMAIGTDGLPILTGYNATGGNLQIVKCANDSCSSLTTDREISDADDVGGDTSIAIGTDGMPIIVNNNETGDDLQVFKCANRDCSATSTFALTSGIDLGTMSSSYRSLYADTINLGKQDAKISLDADGNFRANGFNVSSSSAVTIRNQTDSTAALLVQNASGGQLLTVDTTNGVVKIRPPNYGVNNSAGVGRLTVESNWSDTSGDYAIIDFAESADSGTLRGGRIKFDGSSNTNSINGIYLSTEYPVLSFDRIGANVALNATASTVTIQTTTSGAINIKPAGTDNVVIGTSDTTGTLLVLDTKTGSGDPTCTSGGMYYNSNSTQLRGCVNGAWNNLAGTDVVTSVPTANLFDGRTVRLRAGSSPYDYVDLVYDSTYAKWVSELYTVSVQTANASTTSTTYTDIFSSALGSSLPWRTLDTAGLTPQFRLHVSLDSDDNGGGGATAYMQIIYHGQDVNSTIATGVVVTGSEVSTTTTTAGGVGKDSGWLDIPGGYAVKDLLTARPQVKVTASDAANYYRATILVRWVK